MCKWVFKKKIDLDCNVEKNKEKLVVKGYSLQNLQRYDWMEKKIYSHIPYVIVCDVVVKILNVSSRDGKLEAK
jgi:hypothetical protein